MSQQDFTKKMVIVLRKDLNSWPLTNTIGHIAAFLGNKMKESFDTGVTFQSKDLLDYPRNSQYAVVALSADEAQLKNLIKELRNRNLLWIAYVQEMIDLADDTELEQALEAKNSEDMDVLGVGIFGDKADLKGLTGRFFLWK